MGRLDAKVAIVTGAAQGQGAEIARRFHAEGALLVLTDQNADGANVARSLGEGVLFVQHDVTAQAGWDAVVAEAAKSFGRIDILVNNAGVYRPQTLQDGDEALVDLHYRVNVKGAYLGIASVADIMGQTGGGSIINTSSATGLRAYAGMLAYGTSKWALRGLTKYAAADLAAQKIRVNSIHPGLIDTPMIEVNGQALNDGMVASTPLGRIGTSADIASLMVFLASDESGFITGAEVAIDGGVTL